MRFSIVALMLLLATVPAVAEEISYSVQLEYDSGSFSKKNIILIESPSMPALEGGKYSVVVSSFIDFPLYTTSFSPQLFAFDSPGNPEISRTNVDLLLPWHPNAKSILIGQNDSTEFEIDVSAYSLCNENGNCDANETRKHCASDCKCGNGICEEDYSSCKTDCSGTADGLCDEESDGKCDPDCGGQNDIDCGQANQSSLKTIVLPVVEKQESPSILPFALPAAAIVIVVLIVFAVVKLRLGEKKKK